MFDGVDLALPTVCILPEAFVKYLVAKVLTLLLFLPLIFSFCPFSLLPISCRER